MSFIVRQIAKRADGSDIVRTRTLTATEISVGRGTDCDIQLADLGIMLRHARLTLMPGGVVALEATGGIPLEIDGKFLNRAELRVADRPAINMASHRLTLVPGDSIGDGPDMVEITAERVIAASDAADAGAETEIFSLKGAMPTRRAMAWVLAAAILLGGLLWPVLMMTGHEEPVPEAMVAVAARPGSTPPDGAMIKTSMQPDIVWSSGALSSAHAGLANSCNACHLEAFEATPDRACVACHKPAVVPAHAAHDRLDLGRPQLAGSGLVAAHVKDGLGLEGGRCASCHKEHEGAAAPANLLEGDGGCAQCHDGLSGRLKDTKLVNAPSWDEHPQFRATLVRAAGAIPKFERLSLEKAPQERSGLIYPHALHLSRTNAVANMLRKQGLPGQNGALGCAYCHQPDSDGVRFKPIEMEANCGACHDLAFARDGEVVRTLPHGKPAQVAGIIRDFYLSQSLSPRAGVSRLSFDRKRPGVVEALGASSPAQARGRADRAIDMIFDKQGLCADCHQTRNTGAANAAARWEVASVSLNDHYLPLALFPHKQHRTYDGKTGEAACLACHDGARTSKVSSDVLLPKLATCQECHGGSEVRTNVAATCDTCHVYHGDSGQPVGAGLPVVAGKPGHGAWSGGGSWRPEPLAKAVAVERSARRGAGLEG